ncbi:helix-turn-helix domain-containing protein [Bacteroides sp. 519]|uniref:helix-turn-helix domain-containing protein n=1 Tax=Bacteroides sp. 519 TaxID=2302937 RepID=UPI0013D5B905|nr:helix-turn-helix domain-containing protein [Bacteroides sp. 519]NDV57087.1 DNA-binding protein [Bacteroides sp. 519]
MDEEDIKFEDLPRAISWMMNKLTELSQKIDGMRNQHVTPTQESDKWLNLQDLCAYLPNHPAEQTVYGWTSTMKIPFHKNGKHIRFLKSEIDAWLLGDKNKSDKELNEDVKQYILSKKIAKKSLYNKGNP